MAELEDLEKRVKELERKMYALLEDTAAASRVTWKFRQVDLALDGLKKALEELKQEKTVDG